MNVKKAIEVLSDSAHRGITTFNQDYKDAQKLGIEALKRLDDGRSKGYDYFGHLLPGETQDEKGEHAAKQTPSNCRLYQCNYNLINPSENEQECIGCEYLKDEKWLPRREKGERAK